MSDLADIKPGDDVLYVRSGFPDHCSRATVTRVTATRVMVDDVAFVKSSGYAVGSSGSWQRNYIIRWSDECQKRVDATEAAALRNWLRSADLRSASLTTLREVVRLLETESDHA
jgi:hypothetical protein